MIKKLIFCILLIGSVSRSFATIAANVDRSTIEMGQSFTLNIQLPTTNSGEPQLSQLAQNFTIYNTSRSTQTSIINGHSTTTSTLSLTLMPKELGKQQIPSISFGNDATGPIEIEVVPSGQSPAGTNKDMYIEVATSSHQDLYMGVPFVYSLKLYYSVPLENLNLQPISMATASINPLGKTLQYQSQQNGKVYQVLEQKFLITPNQSGILNIPPIQISGAISDNNSNDIFGFSQPKPFNLMSKSLSVNVQAMPEVLESNNGIIAKTLQAQEIWSQNATDIQVGQPVTRTIKLQATGIQSSSIPNLSFSTPDNANIYPDKTIANDSTSGDELLATKTFKVAYIPTKDGQLTIPAIVVKWWDLNNKSLQTLEIPAKTYKVMPSTSTNNTNNSLTNGTPNIPQYIKSTTQVANIPQQTSRQNKLWYYLTILFAILWLITLFIMFWLFKRYKQPDKPRKLPSEDQRTIEQKKLLIEVYKTCKAENLNQLNQTLLAWAKARWQHRNIYSIMDIRDIVDNLQLKAALEQMNCAIYTGKEFNDYKVIEQQIRAIEASQTNKVKPGHTLPEFYPD